MRHSAHLIVTGNVGIPARPAFAYDLTRGAMVDGSTLAGVVCYGEHKDEGETHPLALDYSRTALPSANTKASYAALFGTVADLRDIGTSDGVSYVNAMENVKSHYRTTTSVLGANAGFGIEWFIYEKPKTQTLKLNFVRWGVAGAGYVFQIRDGRPEFAGLSAAYNATDETTLHTLWALAAPTAAEQTQIANLIAKIYTGFTSLSFENSTGRDEWVNTPLSISFLPEPRGVVRIALEGGAVTAHENAAILATGAAGTLWNASQITVGTAGGGAFWKLLKINHVAKGTIDYGPLKTPPYPDALDGLTYRISADQSGGTVAFATVLSDAGYATPSDGTLEAKLSTLGAGYFGLRATLTRGTGTPWLYGLSARTPQGAFVRGNDVTLDTTALYVPAGSGPREEGNPILDVSVQTERNGERHGSIILRDVNGLTLAGIGTTRNPGIAALVNRRASCTLTGKDATGAVKLATASLFADALITSARYTDLARFAYYPTPGAEAQTGSNVVAKGETRAELEWFDGWHLLRERKCKPPLINDNLRLGAAINAVLGVCGFTLTEGIGAGPLVDGAALGQAWVSTNDANARCADVIQGLLERYGLGLRFFQDTLGAWRLKPLATVSVADFVSISAQSDPDLIRSGSRYIVNAPLDWEFEYGDYYNSFRVIWGENGEFSSVSRVEESIYQTNFLNYLGREKEYDDVVAPDIRTAAAAEYALRSLKFRFSRFTKFGQSATFYHRFLQPGDPITVDGRKCELISIDGTSIDNDAMAIRWGVSE